MELTDLTAAPALEEPVDFSLVLGGPIFQLFRKWRLSGDELSLVHRRILVITSIAWLPLLLLATAGANASVPSQQLSFLHDIEVHVRLLITLPLLIGAELVVHSRIRLPVNAFLTRRIILARDVPRFRAAVASAMRVRNSVPLELGLLVFAFTVGQWFWRSEAALGAATWYATPVNGHLQLTRAGYWYAFVSIPIFQFILLRWYLRLGIWFRFLWHVSRLTLHLVPTHPDRAGGIGFLGKSAYAFGPILFAQGVSLAGLIASRVLYNGADLFSFKMQAGGLIAFFVVVVLGPLTVFTPQLAAAKRRGLQQYGQLASSYVREFEQKWIAGVGADPDALLGSGDIQSLADLGNSYASIREMRPVPFDGQDMLRLAATTAIPLLPLGLTVFSLEELLSRLIRILF